MRLLALLLLLTSCLKDDEPAAESYVDDDLAGKYEFARGASTNGRTPYCQ
jgi:hypothetical protein